MENPIVEIKCAEDAQKWVGRRGTLGHRCPYLMRPVWSTTAGEISIKGCLVMSGDQGSRKIVNPHAPTLLRLVDGPALPRPDGDGWQWCQTSIDAVGEFGGCNVDIVAAGAGAACPRIAVFEDLRKSGDGIAMQGARIDLKYRGGAWIRRTPDAEPERVIIRTAKDAEPYLGRLVNLFYGHDDDDTDLVRRGTGILHSKQAAHYFKVGVGPRFCPSAGVVGISAVALDDSCFAVIELLDDPPVKETPAPEPTLEDQRIAADAAAKDALQKLSQIEKQIEQAAEDARKTDEHARFPLPEGCAWVDTDRGRPTVADRDGHTCAVFGGLHSRPCLATHDTDDDERVDLDLDAVRAVIARYDAENNPYSVALSDEHSAFRMVPHDFHKGDSVLLTMADGGEIHDTIKRVDCEGDVWLECYTGTDCRTHGMVYFEAGVIKVTRDPT